jgi:hypothetical protein
MVGTPTFKDPRGAVKATEVRAVRGGVTAIWRKPLTVAWGLPR